MGEAAIFGLRDAELVAAAARGGSFRAAAESLGVAPSAVSMRIAQIEQGLGVRLFDRARRGARLTPAGRRFLEQAEQLLALRDQIAADLSDGAGMTGSLRIGVAETIVHTRLGELLGRLAEAAPKVRIELSVDVSERLAQALLADEIDIALMMRQWAPRDAERAPIARVPIDWYVAPEAAPPPDAPADLSALGERAVITFSKGTPPAREVARIFAGPHIRPPVIHGSSSLATVIHLTRRGFGVGTLPDGLVAADLAEGRLRRLDLGEAARLTALEFDLCHLAPAVAPFAALLSEGLAPPPRRA